ncbi:MAG: G1 family glutamic endopeptidase [Trebonia sp.]
MSRRLPRFLTLSLAATLPAMGLAIGLGTTAGASTTSVAPAVSHAAAAKAAAKAAIEHLVIGQHSANHRVGSARSGAKGLTDVTSTNWSGYADTGSNFSKVSSSWTEPTPSCSGRTESLAAFWVGIDGYSSSSVEQDGTLIECYQGSAYEYSWWELYPTNDIQVVGQSVAAGDHITASVVRSGSSYTMKVTDSTHSANSFSTTKTSAGDSNSSAEWIAEAPSGSNGVYPLAKFSTWTASSDAVTSGSTSGSICSFADDQITMITSSGATEATPSALNSGCNSFSVTWDRS